MNDADFSRLSHLAHRACPQNDSSLSSSIVAGISRVPNQSGCYRVRPDSPVGEVAAQPLREVDDGRFRGRVVEVTDLVNVADRDRAHQRLLLLLAARRCARLWPSAEQVTGLAGGLCASGLGEGRSRPEGGAGDTAALGADCDVGGEQAMSSAARLRRRTHLNGPMAHLPSKSGYPTGMTENDNLPGSTDPEPGPRTASRR